MRALKPLLVSVWDDWISLMSGIAGVALSVTAAAAIDISGSPIPNWSLWAAGTTCLVIAFYRAWAKVYYGLESLVVPMLQIEQILNRQNTGDNNFHSRLRIKNTSGKIIRDCGATLEWSQPDIGNLPLPLHCSQENPRASNVDLRPGEARNWDVCRCKETDDFPTLEITGVGSEPRIDLREYQLTIRIYGENTRAVEKQLLIKLGAGAIAELHELPN